MMLMGISDVLTAQAFTPPNGRRPLIRVALVRGERLLDRVLTMEEADALLVTHRDAHGTSSYRELEEAMMDAYIDDDPAMPTPRFMGLD